jgi:hypothetical protein
MDIINEKIVDMTFDEFCRGGKSELSQVTGTVKVWTTSELEADAITTLRAAIQQADETHWKLSCGCPSKYGGIPAEWATTDRYGSPAVAYGVICEKHWHEYDAQHPQRAWQGLTDDEIEDEWERITGHSIFGGDKAEGRAMYLAPDEVTEFTRAVETKLKEKNT